jgi:hypothetical protein
MDDQAADGANDIQAAPEPARADPIAGDLVTASFDYDGGREVTVYVPADGPMVPRRSYSPVTASGCRIGEATWRPPTYRHDDRRCLPDGREG